MDMRYHAPYMEWAKTRAAAEFDLAGSNILACTLAGLPGAREAVDLAGANDNGYPPLMEAIAARYGVDPDRVTTAAASHPLVVELDEMQLSINEGPCLDAIADGGSLYAVDLIDDERWPRFGPAAARSGVRSLLAFRLSDRPVSVLNLYARLPAAFGATDRAKALIFATLAGIALDAAGERADDEQRLANLHDALKTRELIGQAQGILIERERITGDQAFDVLRVASQHLNVKLREVARTLVETGQTPSTGKTVIQPDEPRVR